VAAASNAASSTNFALSAYIEINCYFQKPEAVLKVAWALLEREKFAAPFVHQYPVDLPIRVSSGSPNQKIY